MKFYLNERGLLKSSLTDKDACIKEIHQIYEALKNSNCTLCIKDEIFSHPVMMGLYNEAQKYYSFFTLLSQIQQIPCCNNGEYDVIDIKPLISCEIALDLFKLCMRDMHQQIVTLSSDEVVIHPDYNIKAKDKKFDVSNLIGDTNILSYLIYNPPCASIDELFQRVEEKCTHIKFSSKALGSSKTREFSYKNFGFGAILGMFIQMEKVLYPFYAGTISCSEDDIIHQFKELTHIEFSQESNATMQKYGHEREVIIDGITHVFSHHLKLGDNRIYFKYIAEKDTLYIGHAGAHLTIASSD